MSAIRIEGLTKHYGTVRALDGLNLAVEPGTVFGFLGPNGAGKTTTIRVLTGLARATGGCAQVAGVEVTRDAAAVARRIGHLPEEPAFYSWMPPREYLDHVGRVFGLSAPDRAARVRELLDLVGLAEAGKRRIAGVSRGMRQRLGLAQALVNRPEVLFLDEPVSALDPAGRKEVLELIERLRGECTVFMSTHILADVERVCDAVGIVARGTMVAEGPREALLARYAISAIEVEGVNGGDGGLREWAEAVRGAAWVTALALDGPVVRVTVNDVAVARRELLASAAQRGLELNRFEVVKPSLEDVFLRLVAGGRDAPPA